MGGGGPRGFTLPGLAGEIGGGFWFWCSLLNFIHRYLYIHIATFICIQARVWAEVVLVHLGANRERAVRVRSRRRGLD